MSWGEKYIEERADFVKGGSEVAGPCENAVLSVTVVKDMAEACWLPGRVDIVLETGGQEITGAKALIVGANGVHIAENVLEQPLAPRSALKVAIPFDSAKVGDVLQVKLTPIIDIAGERQFCDGSQTVIEDLRPC